MANLVPSTQGLLLSPGGCCCCRAKPADVSPDTKFIDMDWDWDDESFGDGDPYAFGSLAAVDWGTGHRYICEGCARLAATVLGLGDVSELEAAKAKNEELVERLKPLLILEHTVAKAVTAVKETPRAGK